MQSLNFIILLKEWTELELKQEIFFSTFTDPTSQITEKKKNN